MNVNQILYGLRREQKKRENDFVPTCQTDISAMCKDTADCIELLQAQLANDGCNGCMNFGKYENEVEYGASSPCTVCKRRCNDNYTV